MKNNVPLNNQPIALTQVPPPTWVTRLLAEIDSKTFGSGFDDAFAPDATFTFGVARLQGLSAIKEALQKFDANMDTRHEILEFWDGGSMVLIKGQVHMTTADEPTKSTVSAFVHILQMEGEPARIQDFYGAVGPVKF